MNSLEKIIAAEIAAKGAITTLRYMDLCLQHPDYGYYRKGDPLGREGDFITAPEISQMFGEMIGLWCADIWKQMARPDNFVLLELGPGRGTLMQDALRATAHVAGFHEAVRLHLMESNVTLRTQQMEKLSTYKPLYIDSLSELPPLPIIVVANEFFDALPVRQFEKTFRGWAERGVTVSNDRLTATHIPLDSDVTKSVEADDTLHVGYVIEVSPASVAIMADIATHSARHGGAALIIDYGYAARAGQPTVQAVRGHAYADLFDRPGETDLTAHVDFATLKKHAEQAGCRTTEIIGQGDWLLAIGIELRAARLKQTSTPDQAAAIDMALKRLTSAEEMGTLFKAMAVVGGKAISTSPSGFP